MSMWIIVVWTVSGQFSHFPLDEPMTKNDCMKLAKSWVAPIEHRVSVYGCVQNSGKEA